MCVRTDEATTVFLLVNLSEYSVYDNEHGVPREIQFVAVAGELQNLCPHLGEDLEVKLFILNKKKQVRVGDKKKGEVGAVLVV